MSKQEYLSQLRSLLYDIPKVELEEALQYYEDYFEDAGVGNEEKVIANLGSPEKVAKIIRANVYGTAESNQGEFTERGYKNQSYDDRYEVSRDEDCRQNENRQQNNQGYYDPYGNDNRGYDSRYERRNGKNHSIWFYILIGVCCFPFIIGAGCGAYGTFIGIIATIFGVLIGLTCGCFGIFAGSIGSFGVAIQNIGHAPFSGTFMLGIAFLLLAISLYLLVLVLNVGKVIPHIFGRILNSISRWYHRRGRR